MERVQLVSIDGEKQDSNVRNKQDRLVHVAMYSVHVLYMYVMILTGLLQMPKLKLTAFLRAAVCNCYMYMYIKNTSTLNLYQGTCEMK